MCESSAASGYSLRSAAVGWMRTQWHPDCDTFQYTSSPGFAARVTRRDATLNDLMLGPMLQSALWTKDDGLAEIGARGFVNSIRNAFTTCAKPTSLARGWSSLTLPGFALTRRTSVAPTYTMPISAALTEAAQISPMRGYPLQISAAPI